MGSAQLQTNRQVTSQRVGEFALKLGPDPAALRPPDPQGLLNTHPRIHDGIPNRRSAKSSQDFIGRKKRSIARQFVHLGLPTWNNRRIGLRKRYREEAFSGVVVPLKTNRTGKALRKSFPIGRIKAVQLVVIFGNPDRTMVDKPLTISDRTSESQAGINDTLDLQIEILRLFSSCHCRSHKGRGIVNPMVGLPHAP